MSADVQSGDGIAVVCRHVSADVQGGDGKAVVCRHLSADVRGAETISSGLSELRRPSPSAAVIAWVPRAAEPDSDV
jgi:hypothetical protein